MIIAPEFRIREIDVLASVCRESFFEFFQEFWEVVVPDELILNWHIEYLCNELQIVAERVFAGLPKLYDLVINVPPGSTKSTIISQAFPAWVWTRMPWAQILSGSYAEKLALRDAVKTRDIVESDKYQAAFPYVVLRYDRNTMSYYVTTRKGYRLSFGVGGTVTGFHGHFHLIDDPLNPEQSYSDADLLSTNRWMETTLPLRKVSKDNTPLILVQQRLRQNDPSGERLARGGKVKHICIPGELTEHVNPKELRKFYVDGLFDPHRLSREALKEAREILGEYGYAAQILNHPVPLGGGFFKVDKMKLEEHEPSGNFFVRLCRSWDKAGTPDGGNYSAGVLMAVDKHGDYWILDVLRGQWGATEREEAILTTAKEDAKIYGHGAVETIAEIEGGSGGKESAEATVKNLAGFTIITYHPTGDKTARAYAFASQMGIQDRVHILNRSWTRSYKEELRYFDKGKYDDQVDASSGAFNRLHRDRVKAGLVRLGMGNRR